MLLAWCPGDVCMRWPGGYHLYHCYSYAAIIATYESWLWDLDMPPGAIETAAVHVSWRSKSMPVAHTLRSC